jgi:hypothetical protein
MFPFKFHLFPQLDGCIMSRLIGNTGVTLEGGKKFFQPILSVELSGTFYSLRVIKSQGFSNNRTGGIVTCVTCNTR